MFTQEEISKRIRDQLFVLDPEVSLEVGTPERKIIDVVAQSLAEIQFDTFVNNYQLDIESKFGQDLDDFVQLFGFARLTARRASGYVRFSRNDPAPSPIRIPQGTQVGTTGTSVSASILFTTVNDTVIPEGGSYADVPVEATIAGPIGNVSANKINRIITQVRDVSVVNNTSSTSGGIEGETDQELKLRFRNNIFRNIAGTDDQFLALGIANQFTNRATLIGPTKRFQEYLTIGGISGSGGTATSLNPNAKYIYDYNYYLSSEANNVNRFYTPGIDYTFSVQGTTNPKASIAVNAIRNPAPGTAPVAGTSVEDNTLTGNYQYTYTYNYSLGGESAIAPPSNDITTNLQAGTVTDINNSSGTSLAGGTVAYKTVYRKNLGNSGTPTWERIGTVPVNTAYAVTSYDRTSGTATLTLLGGSANLSGIEIGNKAVITGVSGFNGTATITAIGTSSISYINAGSAVSGTVAGTALVDKTAFFDNVLAAVGEPPSNDLTNGAVVFMEHEYLSKWSRNFINITNDYSSLNKVDLYISGQTTDIAEDVTTGPGSLIVNNPTSKYHYANFKRKDSTDSVAIGNYFINLIWTPVRTVPDVLTVNGLQYALNTDYWLVKDVTDLRESVRARDGLEISAAMGAAIDNSIFSIGYTFDKLPYLTNKVIDTHKQLGQDVLVHTANFRNFIVNLVVIYNNGFNVNQVNIQLENNIRSFFNEQYFGAIIQLNDILQIAYNTPGVDSVKIATSADDATHYGVEEVTGNGTFVQRYQSDFLLEDIDLPVLYSLGPDDLGTGSPVAPLQKTQNSWVA